MLVAPLGYGAMSEFLTLNVQREKFSLGSRGPLPLPPEDELLTADGALNPSVIIGHSSSRENVARLAREDGSLVHFSCAPGDSNLDCLAPSGQNHEYYVGRRLRLKYFLMPRWVYPSYFFQTSDGQLFKVASQPAAIAMEVSELTPTGMKEIFSYDQSVNRISQHRRSTSNYRLDWGDSWVLLMTLALLPPALRRFFAPGAGKQSRLPRP
jgi:hypothetical protein